MTVKRTREIFGKQFQNLTDEQILEFIQQTSKLCDSLLDVVLTKNLTPYQKLDYYGKRSD